MATQKAVVIQGPGEAKVVADAPVPKAEKDFIKVKTVAVALNPSDWKHIDWRADKNAVVGFDYAGYVEEVGPDVKKQFQKGDRVLGFTHGCESTHLHNILPTAWLMGALVDVEDILTSSPANTLNHATGAFAEHVIGKGHVAMAIPTSVNFDDASTLGAGLTTIGLSLYKSLELPLPSLPSEEPFPVFVYGGSTATGILAIQFLKL
jgi:NADPH:quinone reductase-like Zn-dependent oxidoreductase